MKKTLLTLLAVAMLSTNVFAVDDGDDTQWFDMMSCGICQHMQPILPHMQKFKWDSKATKHGLITITIVPDDLKEQWGKCKTSMDATIKELESGKEVKCCGFCQSFGSLIEAGAEKEEIKTAAGEIMLLTSNDPKVVKKIHAHVKKTEAEKAKMEKMMEKMQAGQTKDQ